MGKGLRSKVKQHHARVRRMKIAAEVDTPRAERAHDRLKLAQSGEFTEPPTVKNAFLHPNDIDAVFPQYKPEKALDFRQDAVPLQEYSFLTFCRKFPDLANTKEYDGSYDNPHSNTVLANGKRMDGADRVGSTPEYHVANYGPSKHFVNQRYQRHHVMDPSIKSAKRQLQLQRYSKSIKVA